jgi:hypothetical protein
MTFTTNHTLTFRIGNTDWLAEIETDGIGYTLLNVAMDLDGKRGGEIEGEDLEIHGAHKQFELRWVWQSFSDIVAILMESRLSDIIARHEEEAGQNAIDSRADHYRERNEP